MKDERIAVLHVLTDGSFGGALSWLFALFEAGDHSRFRYGVILPKGSEAEKRLARFPIQVIPLPLQKASFALGDLVRLSRAIAAFSPDILQTHGAVGARLIAFFASPHAYLLLTKHCVFASARSRHPFLARASYLLLRPFTHAALATAFCARTLLLREGFPASTVLTVRNGAPIQKRPTEEEMHRLKKRLALSENALILGYSGRLEKEKNPRFLLSLARELAKEKLPFQILVIGDGKEKATLERRLCRAGLAPYFRFVGYQKNPAPYLSLCDVQINCSLLSETSSISLIEGFSLGTPALASSLPGNRELLKNEECGLIYPKGDARACAALVRRLHKDRALLQKLSRGAYTAYQKRFSSALMARRSERFYLALTLHSAKKD